MKNYQFLLLTLLTVVFTFLSKELLNTDGLVANSLAEQLTSEQLNKVLNFNEKWQWVGYALIPIFLLIKIAIIAAVIDIGCFFLNKEIKYKRLFYLVTKAEFIFLLVIVFKTAWFYVFQQDYDLDDLQYFYPLSALNIIGYQGLEAWFIYPMQVINVFELAYWFLLALLIGK